jgi:hypothetical protein
VARFVGTEQWQTRRADAAYVKDIVGALMQLAVRHPQAFMLVLYMDMRAIRWAGDAS